MDRTVGLGVLIAAVVGGSAAIWWLRTRLPRPAIDALLALAGIGIGVGGLLQLHDVGVASWIVCPVGLGILLPLHARALFGGAGPFRT